MAFNRAIHVSVARAYTVLNVVHKLIGNYDKAQEDLRKAIKIDPEFILKMKRVRVSGNWQVI